jgi:hypothetical protein
MANIEQTQLIHEHLSIISLISITCKRTTAEVVNESSDRLNGQQFSHHVLQEISLALNPAFDTQEATRIPQASIPQVPK